MLPRDDKEKNVSMAEKMFLIIFSVMSLWILYIAFIYGRQIVKSPYNKRIDKRSEYIVSGNIYDKNGALLYDGEKDFYPVDDRIKRCVVNIRSDNLFYLLYTDSEEISLIKKYYLGKENRGGDINTTLELDTCEALLKVLDGSAFSLDLMVVDAKSSRVRSLLSTENTDKPFSKTLYDNMAYILKISGDGKYRREYIVENVTLKSDIIYKNSEEKKTRVMESEEADRLKKELETVKKEDKKLYYKLSDNFVYGYLKSEEGISAFSIEVHNSSDSGIIKDELDKLLLELMNIL